MRLRSPELLKERIADNGITKVRLCQRVGISRPFLYQLLAGERNGCSESVAEAIESVLGVRPGVLFVPVDEEGVA